VSGEEGRNLVPRVETASKSVRVEDGRLCFIFLSYFHFHFYFILDLGLELV